MTTVDVVVKDAAGHRSSPTPVTVPVGFDPLTVPGMLCGWDASDPTKNTASNGRIVLATDISGHGHHMAKNPDTLAPTPKWSDARTQNGHRVYDCDGSSYLRTVDAFQHGSPATIYIVSANDHGVTQGPTNAEMQYCSSVETHVLQVITAAHLWRMNNGGYGSDVGTRLDIGGPNSGIDRDTLPHIHCCTFNDTASTYHLDGVLRASGPSGNATRTQPRHLGAQPEFGIYWYGWFGTLLHYSGAHDQMTRDYLTAGLRERWATI